MHSKARKLAKLMKRSEGSLRQKTLKLASVSVINGKTGARFVTVATDSGHSSRVNLVICTEPTTSGLPSTPDLGEIRERVRLVPKMEVSFDSLASSCGP